MHRRNICVAIECMPAKTYKIYLLHGPSNAWSLCIDCIGHAATTARRSRSDSSTVQSTVYAVPFGLAHISQEHQQRLVFGCILRSFTLLIIHIAAVCVCVFACGCQYSQTGGDRGRICNLRTLRPKNYSTVRVFIFVSYGPNHGRCTTTTCLSCIYLIRFYRNPADLLSRLFFTVPLNDSISIFWLWHYILSVRILFL